ncbi:MAG: NADH-quinone oxidoreductase subunit L [Acidimicrobiia bacterium]
MQILESAWLIPVVPLVSAGVLCLLGRRLREPIAGWVATLAVGASFLLSFGQLTALLGRPGDERTFVRTLYEWIPAGGFRVPVSYRVDPLSVVMILLVTGVGALIHLYAIGYMKGDGDYTRFFVYMNLFVGSMLVLVLADNYLLLFVGWELVGACSYLLIGFWYRNSANATAATKAFVVNRIGDFGFVVGLMLIFFAVGSLDFGAVFSIAPSVMTTAMATAVCLCLLAGATGKSAQIPLYVWLPDAMAGPTPVSALIHAATMVTAGVYMIARSYVLWGLSPTAQGITVAIGIITALVAAVIAIGQFNIKKVLAYSTVSQLGYMIAGVGVGGAGFAAGIFHLLAHGFFKALLFLCAGSVIHGMGHEEDMRRMGGLRTKMPITFVTYTVGFLALDGIFPFAGFFSKDGILAALFEHGTWWSQVAWGIGLMAAFLTATYMARQWFMVFFGKPRWAQGVEPHESPWLLTLPLVLLAIPSTLFGSLGLPGFNQLHRWLEPVFGEAGGEPELLNATTLTLLLVSLVVVTCGLVVGWAIWYRATADQRATLVGRLGGVVPFVRNKLYVDEAYSAMFEKPGYKVATVLGDEVDQRGIDWAVMGTGSAFKRAGAWLAKGQNGLIRAYAAVMGAGVLVFVVYVLARGGPR